MKTAEQMLAPVIKLAGEKETDSGNNTTVNKYWNAIGQAYCGYTVWYADRVSGKPYLLDGCANPAYCRTFGEWLTAKGYKLSDNSKAQKGDIAFFCEYNSAEKRWMYQHVFFVYEKVSGTTFITLEGNTQVYATAAQAKASAGGAYEGIGYKKRNMPTGGTWQIFRLPYGGTQVSTNTVSTKTISVSLPQLSFGSAGNSVKAVQAILNANGCNCGKVDGEFGDATLAAVKAFQVGKKIAADGVVGKDTWEKLFE